jgi:hypothetical protein
MRRRVKSPT